VDAGWIAKLLSRQSPEPITADRVERDWSAPGVDRERDVRVDEHGAILVELEDDRAWLEVAGRISADLLAWAERRAREGGALRALSGAWEGSDSLAGLEANGYRRWGESIRMRIELAAGRSATPAPEGLRIRTFHEGDAEAVFRVHLETFQDMTEPMRASFEEWAHWYLQEPLFAPGTWFLAEDGAELAGIALCHADAEVGHVDIVGVRAPWRRRGLGRALLEHAFAGFAGLGLPAAILGAEAASPTGADRLYERVGMRVTHRRLRYEKILST
jgi:ribosomal protein S18 acetylase RimI-like enzyme